MKKILSVLVAVVLCTALLIPVSAAAWKSNTFTSVYDEEPAWLADAEVVEFEDTYEEGATNARAGGYYVYLKNDGKGDFTIEFEVKENGTYDIGFTLMPVGQSVPRSTNVRIDDAEWVYMNFQYTDETEGKVQYITGLQIDLTKGKHTLTLSLASDYDDSTVKSLFYDNFFYKKAADPVPETEAVVVETAAETAAETVAETVTAAPQTFDMGIIAAVAAIVSAAGYAVAKKH